MEITIVKQN